MAFSELLANRVRRTLQGSDLPTSHPVTERKMFGGLCFQVGGHMACGVQGDELMVRVGPDAYESALAEPFARPMDFTGRPLRGLVYVDSEGIVDDDELAEWVGRGTGFATSMPAKDETKKKKHQNEKRTAAKTKATS